jgi:hypothetical protein
MICISGVTARGGGGRDRNIRQANYVNHLENHQAINTGNYLPIQNDRLSFIFLTFKISHLRDATQLLKIGGLVSGSNRIVKNSFEESL